MTLIPPDTGAAGTPAGGTPSPDRTPLAAAPAHPLVRPIRAFKDNYIWLILDATQRRAALVDPGDGGAADQALRDLGLQLSDILVTHHHADHVGGLELLKAAWPGVCVHGPDNPKITGIDHRVQPGAPLALPALGLTLEVIGVPGHTLDHLAYGATRHGDDPRPLLFCGDTLFAGGCGRLFEGTAVQMHASLRALAGWPAQTLIYCAHEYTASNLKFALRVEPDNAELQARAERVARARALDEATVPSTLADEWRTNPFLRVAERSVQSAAGAWSGQSMADPIKCLATVRAWKDQA
jgi:hydroxyacylglutathione hydrolase